MIVNRTTGDWQQLGIDLNFVDVVDDERMLRLVPGAKRDGYFDGFRAIYLLLKDSHYLRLGTEAEGVDPEWSIDSFNE